MHDVEKISVASWKHACKGTMPDENLAQLDCDERAKGRFEFFRNSHSLPVSVSKKIVPLDFLILLKVEMEIAMNLLAKSGLFMCSLNEWEMA